LGSNLIPHLKHLAAIFSMINLTFQNLTADPSSPRLRRASKKYISKFFEKTLEVAVKELNLEYKKTEISMNLIGEGKMKKLNNKYCHKNKVTDVLSFPMLRSSNKLIPSKLTVIDLGDLFICLPFAKKQAKRENISIEEKLTQLTVHGFLHLLGYDHERSRADEKKMLDLEGEILNDLKSKV